MNGRQEWECRGWDMATARPAGRATRRSNHVQGARNASPLFASCGPTLREMILPRRGILLVGFVLMVVNRLSGLVLPFSTSYLIDNVIGKSNRWPC